MTGGYISWRMRICIALFLAALLPWAAHAQDGSPELRREFDALFQQLLADPSNRELNRRYIEVALLLGDYEAAIGALERLLFYAPDDAQINYQIGSLYLQLGSDAVAQTYFQAVVASASAPPDLRQQAAIAIEQATRAAQPSPWSVYAQAGLRYQTNANIAPDQIEEATDASLLETPDWNSFGLLGINYYQPVGDAVIEARLTGYYADQFKVDRLDIGFGELEAGPRLSLLSGDTSSLSIKPYGLVNGVLLGDDPYQRSLGGGIALSAVLGDAATLTPYFEYRDRRYFNSDDYPIATEQTGDFYTFGIDGNGDLGAAAGWAARAGLNQNDARVEDNSYDEYFFDMSLRFQFDPFGGDGSFWTFSPFGGISWTDYAAPDPADGDVVREDFKWKTGASLDIPVVGQLGLGVQVQYTVNESNLDRFDYDNWQVTSGPRLRF